MPEQSTIASVGTPQRVTMNFGATPAEVDSNEGDVPRGTLDGNEGKTQEEIDAAAKLAGGDGAVNQNAAPALNDEQLKEYFKAQGIEYTGIDDLKTKLQPASTQLTPEQIEAQKQAHEKRIQDLYFSKGGTPENWVQMKALKDADVNEVSRTVLHAELLKAGLTEDEAGVAGKQMRLEHDLENLVQGDTEEDEAFTKRKANLEKQISSGAKVLANLGLPVIQKAKSVYDGLDNEIKAIDKDAAEEVELSTNIDAHFKAIPREMTIEIGKINDKDVAPVTIKVTDEAIAKVSDLLKDTQKRDALYYDEKGKFNYTKIAEILLRNEMLEAAVKSSLTEGGTRQVEIFKQTFPDRSAHSLGLGGAARRDDNKKTVASTGKVQRVQPQH